MNRPAATTLTLDEMHAVAYHLHELLAQAANFVAVAERSQAAASTLPETAENLAVAAQEYRELLHILKPLLASRGEVLQSSSPKDLEEHGPVFCTPPETEREHTRKEFISRMQLSPEEFDARYTMVPFCINDRGEHKRPSTFGRWEETNWAVVDINELPFLSYTKVDLVKDEVCRYEQRPYYEGRYYYVMNVKRVDSLDDPAFRDRIQRGQKARRDLMV